MTRKVALATYLVLCSSLMMGLTLNLFADNGGGSQAKAEPPIITPDPSFRESDALRYGGLFGPLPWFGDLRGIGEFSQEFGQPITPNSTEAPGGSTPPNSRDMGYGINVPGLEPRTRTTCDPGALSCPGS